MKKVKKNKASETSETKTTDSAEATEVKVKGSKDSKSTKVEKTKTTPLQSLAADINKVLGVDPALDENAKDLKSQIKEIMPEIQSEDKLSKESFAMLKELGWGKKTKKVAQEENKGIKNHNFPKKEREVTGGAEKPEKVKKEKKAKGPGVISTIEEVLRKGKPVTKEQILEVLVKRFPGRDSGSMVKTINVQVPNRIAKEKGLKITLTDKGYVAK